MVSRSVLQVPLDRRKPWRATLGWTLRRAALGLAILLLAAALGAWLLHASLEPDHQAGGVGSHGGYAVPPG
jgi:hypothetical protein